MNFSKKRVYLFISVITVLCIFRTTHPSFSMPVIDPLLKRANSSWLQRLFFVGGSIVVMAGVKLMPPALSEPWEYTTENLHTVMSKLPVFEWFVSKPLPKAATNDTHSFWSRDSELPSTQAMLGAIAAISILVSHWFINNKKPQFNCASLISAALIIAIGTKRSVFSKTLFTVTGALLGTYCAYRLEQLDYELCASAL